MSVETLVVLVVGLAGGGTVGAVAQALVARSKGVRDADLADRRDAREGLADLADRLEREISSLRDRIGKVEEQLSIETGVKWQAIRYIRRLHLWIGDRVHSVTDAPTIPTDLTDHIDPIEPRGGPHA